MLGRLDYYIVPFLIEKHLGTEKILLEGEGPANVVKILDD